MYGHPVVVRMPEELVKRLDRSSVAMYRSRSAEITARLEASFAKESIDKHDVIVVHSPTPLK
jgi:metal-responsive CopG/Arc/MetJ family transcriptional regulator